MALLKIDFNPGPVRIRQFGVGLILLGLALGGFSLYRGKPHGMALLIGGLVLGTIVIVIPPVGRVIYKAWMSVALVIGTVMSTLILGFVYFGILTPLALFFRLRGRDALRIKKSDAATYWVTMETPQTLNYYERLF